jgi:pimeloyl-ACP methyl ester carboxylesterase
LVVATYLLIHGSGATAWYWHRVIPELEALGHEAIAADLPSDDDAAGLREYTDAALEALGGDRSELVVVGQSLGAFTASMVCDVTAVQLLVLVNAMVPRPGESAGEWWGATGHVFPVDFDPITYFLHDVPDAVAAEAGNHLRRQSETVFGDVWPLASWPDVPTGYVLCRDDRFFPADFQRRMVRDRLSITPREMEGGHLSALSQPHAMVQNFEPLRLESLKTHHS